MTVAPEAMPLGLLRLASLVEVDQVPPGRETNDRSASRNRRDWQPLQYGFKNGPACQSHVS